MKKLTLCLTASLLAACGGGGGGATSTTTPSAPDTSAAAIGQQYAEGLWNGTANPGGPVKMLVQANGSFYQFYGTASPSGQMFGTLRVDSNNQVIFDTDHGKINGSFEQSKTVSAATVRTAATLNFSMSGGTGITRSVSQSYDNTYSSPFTASDLVGNYSGVNVGQNSTFAIDANGNISGSIGSCNFSGTIVPDNAKRFANVNITTNSCVLSLEGVGKALLVGSGTGAQIYVGTQDGYGYTMYGLKL